jgi:cytosine/adenosine deaminase-related metal-dependent hydrolase
MDLIITNANILTLDDEDRILFGSVLVEDGIIKEVGRVRTDKKKVYRILDAEGSFLLPGFVQTHIHTGQTLFRGMADDVDLMDWLTKYIWPMEAAHDESSVYESARLSILEMIASGTTTFLDIGLVHNTHSILRALKESGARGIVCKMLMDGDGIPSELAEDNKVSLSEIASLKREYHGSENGRIRIGVGPRFALSSKEGSLIEAAEFAREEELIITTHSSENIREVLSIKDRFGVSNIAFLNRCGVLGENSVIAHCIWLEPSDFELLRDSGTSVAHCPSANLKLASGFARVPEMLRYGIKVTLGADGAPCNNNLNMFNEMRLAALIHKPRTGPLNMDAKTILKMATIGGARALGLESEIGSIEVGKRGDLIVVNSKSPHMSPADNPYSSIVYSSMASDVLCVVVNGEVIYQNGRHYLWDEEEVVRRANEEKRRLLKRLK